MRKDHLFLLVVTLFCFASCSDDIPFNGQKASETYCKIDLAVLENDKEGVDSILAEVRRGRLNDEEEFYYELLESYIKRKLDIDYLSQISKRNFEQKRINVLINFGFVDEYLDLEDEKNALKHCLNALELVDEMASNAAFERAKVYQYLAFFCVLRKINSEKLFENIEKALFALNEADCRNPALLSDLNFKVSASYFFDNKLEKAKESVERSLNISNSMVYYKFYDLYPLYFEILSKMEEKTLFFEKEKEALLELERNNMDSIMQGMFKLQTAYFSMNFRDAQYLTNVLEESVMPDDCFSWAALFYKTMIRAKMANGKGNADEALKHYINFLDQIKICNWKQVYKSDLITVLTEILRIKESQNKVLDIDYVNYKSDLLKLKQSEEKKTNDLSSMIAKSFLVSRE